MIDRVRRYLPTLRELVVDVVVILGCAAGLLALLYAASR